MVMDAGRYNGCLPLATLASRLSSTTSPVTAATRIGLASLYQTPGTVAQLSLCTADLQWILPMCAVSVSQQQSPLLLLCWVAYVCP